MPIYDDDVPLHSKLYEQPDWYVFSGAQPVSTSGGGNVLSGQGLSAYEVIALGGGGGGGGGAPLPPTSPTAPATGAAGSTSGTIAAGSIASGFETWAALALPWFTGANSPAVATTVPEQAPTTDASMFLILAGLVVAILIFVL